MAIARLNVASSDVHYISRRVRFDTAGIGSADTVEVGALPAGAVLLGTDILIETAFNAGTTNDLTVTTRGGGTTLATNVQAGAGVAGKKATLNTVSLVPTTDTDIIVRYQQTGTAATAGQAVIIVAYIPRVQ